MGESVRPCPRAGCGSSARPVRRAATGNGAKVRIEAPARWRKPPATVTPRTYRHRASRRLYRVIENKTFVVGTGSLLAAWEGPSYDSEITLLKLARDIVRQLEGGAYATLGKFLSATLLEPDWNAQ